MEAHIGQHISQATEMQTLCWSKTSPSFSGAHNSYISWSIDTNFIPRFGMYIGINIPKTIVSYFVRGDIFFDSPCIAFGPTFTDVLANVGKRW